MAKELVVLSPRGFAYLKEGHLAFSDTPMAVNESDYLYLRQRLIASHYTKITKAYADIDNSIETKIIICQLTRQCKCARCLHSTKELNDCDILKKYNEIKEIENDLSLINGRKH